MKVEIDKEALLHGLTLTEKISGRNLTLPVLNCVLLSAHANTLTIRSTNLDLGVEVDIPAKISSEGMVAVPSQTISSFIHSTTTKSLVFEANSGNLSVRSTGSEVVVKGQPYNDFPILPSIQNGKRLSLKPELFVKGIRAVHYSASTSTVKPELAGIYIAGDTGKLTFAATDSFRLAEKVINDRSIKESEPIIIPIRNVAEILRILENINGEIELLFNKNLLAFSAKNIYLTSRIIDGTFPDYQQIIPKKPATEVVVLKQDFTNILKRAIIFSDKFNHLSFSIKPGKKTCLIKTSNPETGEFQEAIPAALSGEAVDINFNHRYLSDALQSIATDSLTLSFAGVGKPLLIRGTGEGSFTYLVMPLNR